MNNPGLAAVSQSRDELPIVIITVDKLNSLELLECKLPTIQRLLTTGACGLMNIRSGAGYTDSGSGYLTIGAGSRATAVGLQIGAFNFFDQLPGGSAASYYEWSLGNAPAIQEESGLIVPEIGLLKYQASLEDHQVTPGRLGSLFHRHGWRTCLLGTIDTPAMLYRPGGLLLMDSYGLIDEGVLGNSLTMKDPVFPYLFRTNPAKVITEVRQRLAFQKIVLVEFGDFARLDLYRDQLNPLRYSQLKEDTWRRLDGFLDRMIQLGAPEHFSMVITAPSISKEGAAQKNLLAPLIIVSRDYPAGLLTSGTTKWPGLVANIDLLPTLAGMAHFTIASSTPGKIVKVESGHNVIQELRLLNEGLVAINSRQRPLLDWYIGLITFGWIAGLLSVYLHKQFVGAWLVTGVCSIPLSMIILPLLPAYCWNIPGFLLLAALLTVGFMQIKALDRRMLYQSGLIWLILIIDQMFGWNLIRFSALGYSAMSGSRYYGLGNEFLGVFLASSLIFAYLVTGKTRSKWPSTFILAASMFILSWPQFGAKFGGIIAGGVGFSYYLIRLYKLKLNNSKLWLSIFGCGLVLLAIGIWDSWRPADLQTHIGKFLRLLLSKDYLQVGQIISRKLTMNLKLTVFSPWIRIILLALALGIADHLLGRKNFAKAGTALLWQSILISGVAAYLINDAGVLAFATCLAYGFSFVLLQKISESNSAIAAGPQSKQTIF
ncbi:MAG: hypothetical protein ACM3X9_03465 [Bacillota bacterium]